VNDDQDAADEIGHDEEGGPSEAQVVEAYDALDQMEIDQRQALREALALLLSDGPDALLAAEDSIRDRLSDDGTHVLSEVVEQLHPKHAGVYWASEDA
jgi:uncharacterized protein with von Willebrand factor type A (vWA) domain